VIGRRTLPAQYTEWNRVWGAPDGHRGRFGRRRRSPRSGGPFAIQANSETRRFEYPWAYHAVELRPDLDVVEIGGGLSGFQFVLARSGLHVKNVDPGAWDARVGWPVDETHMRRMNRAFGTDVELISGTLQQASLADASADIVYSISTVEHIPPHDLPVVMRDIGRILRPGGHAVLTVDLFLDLEPFSDRRENHFGTNVSIASLVDSSGLELVQGSTDELLGFPEFDHRRILASLPDYLVGSHPVVAQCLTLRKA
jgi:SAM-dependent methyltransferase